MPLDLSSWHIHDPVGFYGHYKIGTAVIGHTFHIFRRGEPTIGQYVFEPDIVIGMRYHPAHHLIFGLATLCFELAFIVFELNVLCYEFDAYGKPHIVLWAVVKRINEIDPFDTPCKIFKSACCVFF